MQSAPPSDRFIERTKHTIMNIIKIAAAGAASALLLTGCSQPNITVTDTPSSSASATPEQSSKSEAWETITAFVEATWDRNLDKALEMTAPGSPAAKYSTYQIAAAEAYRTNGVGDANEWTFSYVDDADEGSITIISEDGDSEYVWSDFEVDPQGRVVSWTGDSGPLEDALWSKDVSVKAGPAQVELVGAYLANSGNLFVVLDVESSAKGVWLTDVSYVQDGRANKPVGEVQPYDIPKGTSAYHVYAFDGADFGGKFKAEVHSENWDQQGVISFTVV